MIAVMDLTPMQATRVLNLAVRGRLAVELEARPFSDTRAIRGVVMSRDGDLLRVDVPAAAGVPIPMLIGSYCDVRATIGGELYHFSTCVIDAHDDVAPPYVLLAVPEMIQVANRRRFVRMATAGAIPIELYVADADDVLMCELVDIGAFGIACRGKREDLDDLLLVGDEARVCFSIPNTNDRFDLRANICNKTLECNRDTMLVGLEFLLDADAPGHDSQTDRLRTLLSDPDAGFREMDGER